MKWMLIALWTACLALTNIMLKQVMESTDFHAGIRDVIKSLVATPKMYFVAALLFLSFLLYSAAVKMLPLSVAGPVSTILGGMVTFILGIFFFGEALTALKVVGFGLAISGIAVLMLCAD